MFYLLNPRLWIIGAILAALIASHVMAYRKGAANVHKDWQASIAAANIEARKIEQRRQDRADEAAVLASKRKSVIASDGARTADAVRGLRDAITARKLAEESRDAAVKRADAYGELFVESVSAYRDLAQTCDRHVSDLRLLLDAWPK